MAIYSKFGGLLRHTGEGGAEPRTHSDRSTAAYPKFGGLPRHTVEGAAEPHTGPGPPPPSPRRLEGITATARGRVQRTVRP